MGYLLGQKATVVSSPNKCQQGISGQIVYQTSKYIVILDSQRQLLISSGHILVDNRVINLQCRNNKAIKNGNKRLTVI